MSRRYVTDCPQCLGGKIQFSHPCGPCVDGKILITEEDNSVTLRDYFAAAALTGSLANPERFATGANMPIIAAAAYQMADAMLEARKEGGDE